MAVERINDIQYVPHSVDVLKSQKLNLQVLTRNVRLELVANKVSSMIVNEHYHNDFSSESRKYSFSGINFFHFG